MKFPKGVRAISRFGIMAIIATHKPVIEIDWKLSIEMKLKMFLSFEGILRKKRDYLIKPRFKAFS